MTSPIFLAAPNNGTKINSFDERKINHLMPSELDELTVNVSSGTSAKSSIRITLM